MLVHDMITHPAELSVDYFSGLLVVGPTGAGTFEVAWMGGARRFSSALRAAVYFCKERRRRGFGADLPKGILDMRIA